jgi:hypothetical protein
MASLKTFEIFATYDWKIVKVSLKKTDLFIICIVYILYIFNEDENEMYLDIYLHSKDFE